MSIVKFNFLPILQKLVSDSLWANNWVIHDFFPSSQSISRRFGNKYLAEPFQDDIGETRLSRFEELPSPALPPARAIAFADRPRACRPLRLLRRPASSSPHSTADSHQRHHLRHTTTCVCVYAKPPTSERASERRFALRSLILGKAAELVLRSVGRSFLPSAWGRQKGHLSALTHENSDGHDSKARLWW